MGEQLLGALAFYGLPLLCLITLIASVGVPLPVSLLLIAAGSFADHGEMNAFAVIACATISAVLGDQLGFALGRWGDRKLAARMSRWLGGEKRLEQAEEQARKWGWMGIFLSRWLVTPLGPFVNLISGFTGYPWPRFLLWDAVGELLWVVLYVLAGEIFSHEVQFLSSVLGNLSWAVAALVAACLIGWKLAGSLKGRSGQVKAGLPRGV